MAILFEVICGNTDAQQFRAMLMSVITSLEVSRLLLLT